MEKIGSYVNGNTVVIMYDDGTKVRYIKDGEQPRPQFPESMDLKITNMCDAGCAMCAECSTPDGAHANLNHPLLDSLHPYTELAIGGGNPLAHPMLLEFLKNMKRQKVICNLTVNQKHFIENLGFLHMLTDFGLIHGLGVSIPETPEYYALDKLRYFPNAVVHTIAGYTPIETYRQLSDRHLNLLILGFKDKGNGELLLHDNIYEIKKKMADLERWLTCDIKRFRGIAFDNLAVKQLHCDEWMPYNDFKESYMGDDGEFTMYVDLVKGEYAKSSTHPTKPIDSNYISELFANVKQEGV